MVGTAPAWFALLTVVLVPLVIAVMRAERPMSRLPAGIGRPGPWSPVLLLAATLLTGRAPAAGARPQAVIAEQPRQPPKAA